MRSRWQVVGIALIFCATACSSGKAKTTGEPRQEPSSVPVTALSARDVLRRVSWQPGDLRSPYHAVLFGGGDQVTDEVTLDLCGAKFPSEARRRARHQVGVADAKQRDAGISIEAVLYDSPDGAAQAMREVRAAQRNCPSGFVQSDVQGVPPLRYQFAPAPDRTWPTIQGMDRFVVAATVSDQHGHSGTEEAIYQQRGRLLVILYASDPKTNARVLTRPVEGFTDVIARRMAALPANAVT
jgi:hypothetical protein